jgi:hypothetical protein
MEQASAKRTGLCKSKTSRARRERTIAHTTRYPGARLPALRSPSDAATAMGAIVEAVATGDLTTSEAAELSRLVEIRRRGGPSAPLCVSVQPRSGKILTERIGDDQKEDCANTVATRSKASVPVGCGSSRYLLGNSGISLPSHCNGLCQFLWMESAEFMWPKS